MTRYSGKVRREESEPLEMFEGSELCRPPAVLARIKGRIPSSRVPPGRGALGRGIKLLVGVVSVLKPVFRLGERARDRPRIAAMNFAFCIASRSWVRHGRVVEGGRDCVPRSAYYRVSPGYGETGSAGGTLASIGLGVCDAQLTGGRRHPLDDQRPPEPHCG